jgi:hypothetical protein
MTILNDLLNSQNWFTQLTIMSDFGQSRSLGHQPARFPWFKHSLPRVKPTLWTILSVALLLFPASGRSQPPPESKIAAKMVAALEDYNNAKLNSINVYDYLALPQRDRDGIALAAAKSLVISNFVNDLPGKNLGPLFQKPYRDLTPQELNCRRRLGWLDQAVTVLRNLQETVPRLGGSHQITDPRVVPYLIDVLSTPKTGWPGGGHFDTQCFYVLSQMTSHYTGWDLFESRVEDGGRTREKVIAWWREWWKRTEEKDPVGNLERAAKVRADLTKVLRKIKSVSYPELSVFSYEHFQFTTVPWCYDYIPRWSANFPPGNVADNDFELSCRTRFQMSDLRLSESEGIFTSPNHSALDSSKESLIFSKQVPGTEIIIEVAVITTNVELKKDLTRTLQKVSFGN